MNRPRSVGHLPLVQRRNFSSKPRFDVAFSPTNMSNSVSLRRKQRRIEDHCRPNLPSCVSERTNSANTARKVTCPGRLMQVYAGRGPRPPASSREALAAPSLRPEGDSSHVHRPPALAPNPASCLEGRGARGSTDSSAGLERRLSAPSTCPAPAPAWHPLT